MSDNLDSSILIAAISAIAGKDVLTKIIEEGFDFISNVICDELSGFFLIQDYKISCYKNYDTKKKVYLNNIYFDNQFEIIEKSNGTIAQINGNSFFAYWNSMSFEINKLITGLNTGINLLNEFYMQNGYAFSVNNLLSYIDFGSFFMIKNGSVKRFVYCPMGSFINKSISIANCLQSKKPNKRWYIGDQCLKNNSSLDLKPKYDIEGYLIYEL